MDMELAAICLLLIFRFFPGGVHRENPQQPGPGSKHAKTRTKTPLFLLFLLSSRNRDWGEKKECILRGSNPRGLCPMGLKSIALTTRPRMRSHERKEFLSACIPPFQGGKKVCVQVGFGPRPSAPFWACAKKWLQHKKTSSYRDSNPESPAP